MTMFTHLTSALILTGLCFAGIGDGSSGSDAGEIRVPDATSTTAQAGSAESAEGAVQDTAATAGAEQRSKLVDDAVAALDETEKALSALEANDPEAALAALAVAAGKLDLTVARNPALATAPIDVRAVTHDLYASVDAVEKVRERALELLEDGHVQDARELLEGLRSDLVIETWSVPLVSYSAAIKAVSPLIDAGELDAARAALQSALSMVVVTERVHPLPLIRAREMLTRAEELAETAERDEAQSEDLDASLEGARTQMRLARALGYGTESALDSFEDQLDEIVARTEGGEAGTGFFDKIKRSLRAFGDSSESEG